MLDNDLIYLFELTIAVNFIVTTILIVFLRNKSTIKRFYPLIALACGNISAASYTVYNFKFFVFELGLTQSVVGLFVFLGLATFCCLTILKKQKVAYGFPVTQSLLQQKQS